MDEGMDGNEPTEAAASISARDPLPVSVVVPTIGRVELLRACLASIAACRPAPAEIVVVDQSGGTEVRDLVASLADHGARWVSCEGRGIARNTNRGVRAAAHDLVLVTHDDCTVAPDWVGVTWKLLDEEPTAIVSGRVLPVGDPEAVPSCRDDPEPRDLEGVAIYGQLYPANMAFNRLPVLAIGGFDERATFNLAAEDNDLCYRWLKAGGLLRYRPEMVVWHHDWRTPRELERMYVTYGKGQGAFYGKHLYQGDVRMLRFLWWDVRQASRGLVSRAVRKRERWTDPRRGLTAGVPLGIVAGWRESRTLRKPYPQHERPPTR